MLIPKNEYERLKKLWRKYPKKLHWLEIAYKYPSPLSRMTGTATNCDGASLHVVKCWNCQQSMKVIVRGPRIGDNSNVGSISCKNCGEITTVSIYVHAIIGFGKPMPLGTMLKSADHVS